MLLTLRLLRTPLCLRFRLLPCSPFRRKGRPVGCQQSCNLMQSAPCRSDIVLAHNSSTERHDIEGTRSRARLLGYDIEGISVAGQETCVIFPQLKLAFDFGRCPQRAVYQQTVLVSHGHLDHIGGLPFHVSTRLMLGLKPSVVIVPVSIAAPTRALLDAFEALDNAPKDCSIIPLDVGEEYQLPSSKLIASPFPTCHPVPSQGYVLYAEKRKLKPSLQGLSQQDIKLRRLAGEEVTDTLRVPEIAFTGDTSGGFLELGAEHDVFRARLLIMELTFLDAQVSVQEAQEKGHFHIQELVENAHMFKNEAILLIHFSSRYSAGDIQRLLQEQLPEDLQKRCHPFLTGFR